MQLSDKTFDVLKNFSSINPSIAINSGSVIRTVSEQKNILAQASITETFGKDFAVYDLNRFLGTSTLFESPAFDFSDDYVTMSEGKSKVRYFYTDPSMVTTPPEKNLELPSVDVEFELDAASYKKITQAANQLQMPEVVVRGNGSSISLVATDSKNPTADEFSIEVGDTTAEFQFVFKVENLKFMSGDYDVNISKAGIAHFVGEDVQYWVATENGSKYG